MFYCKECGRKTYTGEDDHNHGTGKCYYCFEADLEDYENQKRERIARNNEY